jgi:hypothetical protein
MADRLSRSSIPVFLSNERHNADTQISHDGPDGDDDIGIGSVSTKYGILCGASLTNIRKKIGTKCHDLSKNGQPRPQFFGFPGTPIS